MMRAPMTRTNWRKLLYYAVFSIQFQFKIYFIALHNAKGEMPSDIFSPNTTLSTISLKKPQGYWWSWNYITDINVNDEDEIMLITTGGVLIRTRVSEIRELGRATQGVTLINLGENEKLSEKEILNWPAKIPSTIPTAIGRKSVSESFWSLFPF